MSGVVSRIRSLWRGLFRRSTLEAEMDEEFRLHLELRTEHLIRTGLSPAEAQRRARLEFGGVERFKEEARESRGLQRLDALRGDLRYAMRSLRRGPAFAAAAVLTLALGIGANAAIFSVVSAVLLEPPPYPEPHGILTLWQDHREHGVEEVAPANFLDWRERSRSFERMAAAEPFSMDYLGPEGPAALPTWLVTEGFFDILRTPALLGRTLVAADHVPGAERVVVLGHSVWSRVFGGDSAIVGRTLILDDAPATVVGVMPARFEFPPARQLWAPKTFSEWELQQRRSAYYTVIGRLAAGTGIGVARAEMDGIAEQLAREHPATNELVGVALVPLPEHLAGQSRPALLMLLGAVGFLLLIACVNVTNLLLARAVHREREFAIRAALGASRRRVIRQLLTEGGLLAGIGCVLAVGLASLAIQLVPLLEAPGLAGLDALRLDHRVLGFTLVISVGTALVVGLAPALEAGRGDLQRRLRSGGHGAAGAAGSKRLRIALVAGQLALATVLLVGAGLLVRSFVTLLRVDPGFRTENVLAVTVQTWQYYPQPSQRAVFVQQTVERIAQLPGVRSAGVTSSLPLADAIGADAASLEIPGRPSLASGGVPTVHAAAVTTGYLEALGVALRAGRLFDDRDHGAAAPVALVNEAMAVRYWPDEDPLGRRIMVGFAGPPVEREVVGVLADVRHGGLHAQPRPAVYLPHAQAPTGGLVFVVRAAGDAAALLPAVREEIWAMNRAMPIASATTLEDLRAISLGDRRFNLLLLFGFSVLAVGLAGLGVYGLVSHETGRRTRELGLRLALGADPGGLRRLVLGEALRIAVAALSVGLLLAFALARTLEAFLYDVSPYDPLTFAVIGVLMVAVTLLASYVPARRATAVDPTITLRAD